MFSFSFTLFSKLFMMVIVIGCLELLNVLHFGQ